MKLLTGSIAIILLLAACSSSAAATRIQFPDCQVIEVTGVIDVDTFESSIGTIRLFGIDAPEKGQRCSAEATERLTELLGSTARVETGPRLRDRYGRRLRYVYTESGDSVDEILIREGLALAWTRDGQHRDRLVRVRLVAMAGDVGCLN